MSDINEITIDDPLSPNRSYILFGASASGKGTQSTLLKKALEETGTKTGHVQTGELIREFIESDGPLAHISKKCIESGKLVPTLMVTKLLADTIIKHVTDGITTIFDGYPRNRVQAEMLDQFLAFAERDYVVIHIEVPQEILIQRMQGRSRSDDSDKAIEKRLQWYFDNEKEVTDFWKRQGITIHSINGNQSIDAIHKQIVEVLQLTS